MLLVRIMQLTSSLLGVQLMFYQMIILKTFLIVLKQWDMMSQEEYLKLLFKLITDLRYSSYSARTECRVMHFKNGYSSLRKQVNKIEDKVFIGLVGYSGDYDGLPDSFFKIQETFTNGAMLVEQLVITQ